MRNIHELLIDKRVGLITAHPDDHLPQVHAVMAAHAAGATVRELTLTRGRKSTINHRRDRHFVSQGRRGSEGESAARYLGLASNDHLDLPDGELAAHVDAATPDVAEWIDHHGIDLLLTLGGIADHPDHLASADIARRAGARLWDNDAYAIGVLELQMASVGEWGTPATREGIITAFGGARWHASQFQVSGTPQANWEQIDNGMYAHPDTVAGLDRYPIRRDPTYIWLPPAMLAEIVAFEPVIEHG
jgi:LmbE family N-acetylglucosaminyl deacetylase